MRPRGRAVRLIGLKDIQKIRFRVYGLRAYGLGVYGLKNNTLIRSRVYGLRV